MAVLDAFLDETRLRVADHLEAILDEIPHGNPLRPVMRAAILPPGKCFRAAIARLTGRIAGQSFDTLDYACAIEMIHAASLVLDDLPCMDAGTVRRGRPALHLEYGQARAILAAVTLVTEAFRVVAEAGADEDQVATLAECIGSRGVAFGEALDLEASTVVADPNEMTREWLEVIHDKKTAALFRAAALLPIGGCSVDPMTEVAIGQYATNLGLAFQLADDIRKFASLEGPEKMSARTNEPNMAGLVGLQEAIGMLRHYSALAVGYLQSFGAEADLLRRLAEMVAERGSSACVQ